MIISLSKGEGHHTISVIDSGIEIADSSLQDQNLVLELELIREQSGNAHFTLTDFSGEKTSTIDGGAYMYALKTKDHNGGKSWYLAPLETTSTSVTPSSHTEFPIGKLPEKEENITSSQDVNINFDPYFDVINFSIREGGGILQNFWLGDDRTVHISDDGEQGALKQSMNATVEGSGILYVETGGSSKNTTVERGGSEIIGEQGISNSTIIYEGGQQKVEGGGTALQTTIYGGDQLIWGDSYENGGIVGSSAYDTILYGQGETPGQQNVYDDGMAVETKVMSGGIQTLAKWFPDDDNFAEKSRWFSHKY